MTRIEIVRTTAPQPWHARIVTSGRITWRTENYTRMIGAERAVLALLRIGAPLAHSLRWNVEGIEKVVVTPAGGLLTRLPTVLYVDER